MLPGVLSSSFEHNCERKAANLHLQVIRIAPLYTSILKVLDVKAYLRFAYSNKKNKNEGRKKKERN